MVIRLLSNVCDSRMFFRFELTPKVIVRNGTKFSTSQQQYFDALFDVSSDYLKYFTTKFHVHVKALQCKTLKFITIRSKTSEYFPEWEN